MIAVNGAELAKTRRELFYYLSDPPDSKSATAEPKLKQQQPGAAKPESTSGLHWSPLVKAGLSSWWHDHPARAGACLLKSATEEYARKRPLQVVTIAAVAGAAIVLFKPWRLVSATALMLSLFRSSNFTGIATSVLETAAQSMQKDRQ